MKAQGCTTSASTAQPNSLSSTDAEQLTPMHGRETHCGAGGRTVTIEKLRHCQPTPLLFSPRRVCVTIPTCSEPRGSRGRRHLQHAEHVMKPSQTFCSAVTTTAPCYPCCFQHKSKPYPIPAIMKKINCVPAKTSTHIFIELLVTEITNFTVK